MSNAIVSFEFEGHSVRGFDWQGEPHFIGNEVAAALGYAFPKDAVSDHCKALKLFKSVDLALLGIKCGPRGMNVIPERDVYRLVMRSNLPTAIAFEEKVVGEILPSIRKTGGYGTLPNHSKEALAHIHNLAEEVRLLVDRRIREAILIANGHGSLIRQEKAPEPSPSEDPIITANQLQQASRLFQSLYRTATLNGSRHSDAVLTSNAQVLEATGVNLRERSGGQLTSTGKPFDGRELINAIRGGKKQGVTRGHLTRTFNGRYRAADLDEMLQPLVQSGEIAVQTMRTSRRGAPSKIYTIVELTA